ncbi:FecR domain-containing protein [Endozoicomonas sp. G2_1]|uniref:FecR domain-containing protein n=1 Tax=Endozoicomonas sp. G2_1 TaxID=2821091 RepID=UPI001ADC3A37|nr:FecR domain-containing protein [Endozoicomonas sp. G2_1]MBO9489682.1 FecR domain-containing protein [Endozoicomonas sp. G2_1]
MAVKKVPENIVQQAIAWHIRLASSQQQSTDVEACNHWRAQHTDHELAWQRLLEMDSTFAQVADQAPTLAQSILLKTDSDYRSVNRRQALKVMARSAMTVAVVSGIAYQQGAIDYLGADYVAYSASKFYLLQDNSELWLNKNSAAKLNFSSSSRQLDLSRGELKLNAVAEHRPFSIQLPFVKISSQQASFFVRHHDEEVIVQVMDGSVSVNHLSQNRFDIKAGQSYRVGAHSVQLLDNKMFDYSSWVDGIFSVRNMPLSALLAELSNYRSGFLRCAPSLAEHLVSGVYQLSDTDLILKTLALSAQAEVRYLTRWWTEIIPSR